MEKREPRWPAITKPMERSGGAFVTLHALKALRGCIGRIGAPEPLYETVRLMARAAAFEDPRFAPLGTEELGLVTIEISILSPLEQISDTRAIRIGRHGLLVRRGWRSGLLLPQVALEQGWDLETFVSQTCLKAGLGPDAWKSPETRLEIFEGIVFGES